MKKFSNFLLAGMLSLLLLTACGSGEETSGNNDGNNDTNSEEQKSEEAGNENEQKENEQKANEEEENTDEETVDAVAPESSSDEISFTQVSWMMGSPDRRPNAGVWYYTKNEHPSSYDDTFDWEKEDILLWQISDKNYQGYDADTELLVKMDNDVVKIVVDLEKDDDPSDKKMPRNFLKVDKEVLEGKSFIIETVDGEELSLK